MLSSDLRYVNNPFSCTAHLAPDQVIWICCDDGNKKNCIFIAIFKSVKKLIFDAIW